MTEYIFYNRNHLIKTDIGYQITSLEKIDTPCGIKIKLPVCSKIILEIDIDTLPKTFIVGFVNNKYNNIYKFKYGNNLKKKLLLETKNYTDIGILYIPQNKNDKLVLRKFKVEKCDKEINNLNTLNHRTYFDQIYFINLEQRPTRRHNIISQLKLLDFDFSKVFPIKAIYYPKQPQIGCALSHMKALQHAYINNYQKILILEDDFIFEINSLEFSEKISQLEDNFANWDIVQLSTINEKSENTKIKSISKVIKADTTAGYMVKYHHIITLFNVFKTCLNPNPIYKGNKFAIDVAWQPIQKTLNWYLFKPYIGRQGEQFPSDIEKFRSYNWIS